jgi:small-conductance mechanosensitive channel
MPYLSFVPGRIFADWRDWSIVAILSIGAIVVGLAVHRLLFGLMCRLNRHRQEHFFGWLIRFAEKPGRFAVPLITLLAAIPWFRVSPAAVSLLSRACQLALIASLGWLAIALLNAVQEFIGDKYAVAAADNLTARGMRTQVQVLRHIAVGAVVIVTLAVMLMTFPSIRHIGESLFASAGLAAVLAGLAARATLTNLLAGVQIALTQPIRLDDVVIVEGEWGWIEEINTTYVVVRVWDLRRLVVPLSYFIEKPFQNWTRRTSDLLGTVFIYTDYSVPVGEIRQALHDILQSSSMWDGRTWDLQVTNATDRSMELRALMSAADSSKAWDLRCYVREKLIEFLQREYPQSLPRVRAELNTGTAASRRLEAQSSDRVA